MLYREGTENFDAMTSPSVMFQGIKQEAAKNAMTSPSVQFTSGLIDFLKIPAQAELWSVAWVYLITL